MADEEPSPVEGSPKPEPEQTTAEPNDAEATSEDKEVVSAPQADAEQQPASEDAIENTETAPDAVTEAENEPEAAETSADVETDKINETVEETAADTQPNSDDAEAAAPLEGETTAEENAVEGETEQTDQTDKPTDVEKQEGEEGQSNEAQSGEAASGDAEPGEAPAEGEQAASAESTEGGETSEQPSGEPQYPEQAEESAEKPEDGEAETQEEKPAESEMPQSDTFADGEKPESPAPHVGEVLSREGSPSACADQELPGDGERQFSPPVADSPRESQLEEHIDVEELEEEIISPEQNREALVEMYHAAIVERENLQQQNHQLQHKLAEYFRKKKTDEQKSETVDKNEADQEQRYLKYMSQLEELRSEDQFIRDTYAREIAELEQRCTEKQQEVDAHRGKFVEFKHQVALNSLNSRSGKPIPPKDIEQYLANENRKDQEVIAVRLENIKLKNKLKKKEQQLKSKEELADGLHLIDFEQLKIENQTYNEKIEERNEELLKLRKKITNTVQVLTHLKEKLQFVQGENSLLKNKLKDVEGAVAQKRDVLTRTKQARDALRIDNHRLRQNCGLLGNEPLLRDFEERKDETDALKDRLERLKMQHAELTLNTASVRRKIEQIKTNERN